MPASHTQTNDTKMLVIAVFHAFIMAVCASGILVFVRQWQYAFTYRVFGIMVASIIIIAYLIKAHLKTYRHRTLGLALTTESDTLNIMQADDCDYLSDGETQIHCPNCQSYRVVSLFDYKQARKRVDKFRSQQLEHLNEKYHMGCLSCFTTYRLRHPLHIELAQAKPPIPKTHIIGFLSLAALSILVILYAQYIPFLKSLNEMKDVVLLFSVMWMNSFSLFVIQDKGYIPSEHFTEVTLLEPHDI